MTKGKFVFVNDAWSQAVQREIVSVLRASDLSEKHRVGMFVELVQHEILKVLNSFVLGVISALIVNGDSPLNTLKSSQVLLTVHDVIMLLKGSLCACGISTRALRVFCLDCDEYDAANPEGCSRCDVVKRIREAIVSTDEIENLYDVDDIDTLRQRNNPH